MLINEALRWKNVWSCSFGRKLGAVSICSSGCLGSSTPLISYYIPLSWRGLEHHCDSLSCVSIKLGCSAINKCDTLFPFPFLSKLHKLHPEYWGSEASLLSDGSLCCQHCNTVWRQPSLPLWALYSTAPYLLLYVNTDSLKKKKKKKCCVVAARQGAGSEAKRRNGRQRKRIPLFFFFFSRSNPA